MIDKNQLSGDGAVQNVTSQIGTKTVTSASAFKAGSLTIVELTFSDASTCFIQVGPNNVLTISPTSTIDQTKLPSGYAPRSVTSPLTAGGGSKVISAAYTYGYGSVRVVELDFNDSTNACIRFGSNGSLEIGALSPSGTEPGPGTGTPIDMENGIPVMWSWIQTSPPVFIPYRGQ